MTGPDPFRPSRRSLLRSLGVSGLGVAGVLAVTTQRGGAYAQEITTRNPRNLRIAWTNRYNGSIHHTSVTTDQNTAGPVVDLGGIMPGDSGSVALRIEPAPTEQARAESALWMQLTIRSSSENGLTEPEVADERPGDAASATGELADALQLSLVYDSGIFGTDLLACDGSQSPLEFSTIASGSMTSVAARLDDGYRLEPPGSDACFTGGDGVCVVLEWSLPTAVGNAVQSDSVMFDLSFRSEPCRNPESYSDA